MAIRWCVMTDSLTDRLRNLACSFCNFPEGKEAADALDAKDAEIERLKECYEGEIENRLLISNSHDKQTAEIERLREKFQSLCDEHESDQERWCARIERMQPIIDAARKVLDDPVTFESGTTYALDDLFDALAQYDKEQNDG